MFNKFWCFLFGHMWISGGGEDNKPETFWRLCGCCNRKYPWGNKSKIPKKGIKINNDK